MTVAYDVLRELRCAVAREVAARLGVAYTTARAYLERLVEKGLAEKRRVGRLALYCVRDVGIAQRGSYKLYTETRRRMWRVEELLAQYGCVSVAMLEHELRVTHHQAYHLVNVALLTHRGVKMVVGKTAVLCRDRQAAEETIARLRETVHRLAVENRVRYASAAKMLRLVVNDREAYFLFRRFLPSLWPGARRFPPAVLAFMETLLRSLYGDPLLRQHHKLVYAVAQPRSEHGIEIVDSIDVRTLYVELPDDLAAALQGGDADQVTIQAIEQLLARYRS